MEKFSVWVKVTILVCFSVHGGFSTCSDEINGFVESPLGRNVTLSCTPPFSCNAIHWMNHSIRAFIPRSDTLSHTSVYRLGSTSFLRIYGMILGDAGPYSCWCYNYGRWVSNDAFCSITLSAICQATVRLHRVNILYNGSYNSPSSSQAVRVTAGDTIKVVCSQGATPETNCHHDSNKVSPRFTYNFDVLPRHHLCNIACIERESVGNICAVTITLHVSEREPTSSFSTLSTTPSTTFTRFVEKIVHTSPSPLGLTPSLGFTTVLQFPSKNEGEILVPAKPDTFPVTIFVGILTFILLAVTVVVCLLILFSRSRSNSRSKKTIHSVNSPSDASVPIGPIYASVHKSSQGHITGDGESLTTDREAPSVEAFYSEVNRAGKESTTERANIARAESAITNDFYSAVNISNATMGLVKNVNESENTLYSEVNKIENQSRRKECTSSPQSSVCDPSVFQQFQVLKQRDVLDNDTDIPTSQALYAVVEKDKRKE